MKLIIVIMTAFLMQVSASSSAQLITIKEKNATLKRVFSEIRRQTGYVFLYKSEDLEKTKLVNLDISNSNINEALKIILENQGLEYAIEDKSVVVSKKESPAFLDRIIGAFAVIDVSGRVLDVQGNGLSGASVKVKGTGKTVNTNADGVFNLDGVAEDAVLMISYIGYEILEISVKHLPTSGSIVLKESISKLDETVVIGYGTITKRLNTGSVVSVNAAEIARQPVTNPLNALQGKMPGVFVTNTGGLPGSAINVQIRGINSIVLNNDKGAGNPLFIVDGVPYPNTPLNQWNAALSGANGTLSPLNGINPDDIESIDVLKDADATAIYGSRGANGVVLITTKKGVPGKTKLDVNYSHGVESASNMIHTLNTQQYLEIRREGFANDKLVPSASNALDLMVFDQNAYTDFTNLVMGHRPQLDNVQVNISGGNKETRFMFGGNYRNQGTILGGDLNYHRGGMHLNLEHSTVDQKFFMSLTGNYNSDKNNNITQSVIGSSQVPNFPLYDANGKLNWVGGDSPLAYLLQSNIAKSNNLVGNGIFRYTIIPGLNAQASLGYTYNTLNSLLTTPKAALNPNASNAISKAFYGNNALTSYIFEPQLNYLKQLGGGKLSALLGGTWQYSLAEGSYIQGQNYSNDGLLKNMASAGTLLNPATNFSEYKYLSVFSRINYNWGDRYIVNATFRRDGSSRFGPGKEFGNFGSGGLAWLFANEDFIKRSVPFLSYGKLRTSYGWVGNDQIADYGYLSTYQSTSAYQGVASLYTNRIANPDFSWEVTRKLEVALELGFLQDRILLTAEWFKNKSDNQLVGYPLPSQTGFKSYQANLPATIQNTGTEFSLNTENIKTAKFSWKSSFNLSFLSNKLVSFPGLASTSYASKFIEGQSVSILKGYDFVRIDPKTGIPLFATASGEEKSTPSMTTDFPVMGKTLPDFYGGLSNSLSYQGLELDFLFQFVKQEGKMPPYWPGFTPAVSSEWIQRWQKDGDITEVPVAISGNVNNNATAAYTPYANSDKFWVDASYIRLKNLSLSYNLPKRWLDKARLNQCKVFVQGQNLLTFTGYKGSDPEIPTFRYIVPTLRTIAFGLQFSL